LRKSDAVCWSYANASVYLCNAMLVTEMLSIFKNINNSSKK